MEVKDLVALSEQHMRTLPFSKARECSQTCLSCLCIGRTQFSTALEVLRYPFNDQSLLFKFCATCLLLLCRAFHSAGPQIYSALQPFCFTSSSAFWCCHPLYLLLLQHYLQFCSWLTSIPKKCSRQEKYEVMVIPKNDWDRTRKMGSHGSSLT